MMKEGERKMMRKTMLAVLMTGLMLATIFGAISASAASRISTSYFSNNTRNLGFNIGIESVTYEPNPPKKGESITFSVTMFTENWERSVLVYYSIDGQEHPIPYWATTDPDDPYNFDHLYCDIEQIWPDDTNEHTVKIRIDCQIPGGDDNPADDVWTSTLKAKGKGRSLTSSISIASLLR